MTSKIVLFTLVFIGLQISFAQENECDTKLQIFHQDVKSGNMDAAYDLWMYVRNNCPKYSLAIYTDGEKILEDKIEKSTGSDKEAFINDLLKLWDQRAENFPDKTPKGEFEAQSCQFMYDNRGILNKNDEELYNCFDEAYKTDKETFNNPKSLYTYFSLMVQLYDAGNKPAAELFSKYDDVSDKVDEEVENYSRKLNELIQKVDSGVELTNKEEQYKKFYESYLRAYDQISQGIAGLLGDRANCKNLVPIYTRDFEENKGNSIWLKRAVSKMYQKECTDDPLYEKLVKAFDEADPSAFTKYWVGTLLIKNNKESEAMKYFKQAYELEADAFKKADLAFRIGVILKNKGRYGQARSYFDDVKKLNPSNGKPYIAIASMYADSANDCGDTNFNKRAVYWLAADEARNAARVDPTLKSHAEASVANYMAKAPSKSEVFQSGRAGEVIKIGCWINRSVTVPKIN